MVILSQWGRNSSSTLVSKPGPTWEQLLQLQWWQWHSCEIPGGRQPHGLAKGHCTETAQVQNLRRIRESACMLSQRQKRRGRGQDLDDYSGTCLPKGSSVPSLDYHFIGDKKQAMLESHCLKSQPIPHINVSCVSWATWIVNSLKVGIMSYESSKCSPNS